MGTFKSRTFEGQNITLDGNVFYDCVLRDCRIKVSRGNYRLKNVTFEGCHFAFSGEAENIRKLVLQLEKQEKATLFSEAARQSEGSEVGAT